MSDKVVKINLKRALINRLTAAPKVDSSPLATHLLAKPPQSRDLPDGEGSPAKRLKQYQNQKNGSRSLDMASHIPNRKRRHRHAESTDIERAVHMSYDGNGNPFGTDFEDTIGGLRDVTNAMSYTWEESDRMFHSLWNGGE
tara:strand:- start:1012 stop:1434 length:423 start_codon:yes stop_codon:yes gene_type:complete